MRPLSSVAAFALAAGLLLSLIFYNPDQNPYFSTSSSPNELVGAVGVQVAGFVLYVFGLTAWAIPVFPAWMSYLFMMRRGHLINVPRVAAMLITIISLSGLLTLFGEDLWGGALALFPENYLPLGLGGWIGRRAYVDMLQEDLGALLGGLVLMALFALGILQSFANILDLISTRYQEWRDAKALEKKRRQERRREEKLLAVQEKERLKKEEKARKKKEKEAAKRAKKDQGKVEPEEPEEEPKDLLSGIPKGYDTARLRSDADDDMPDPGPHPMLEPGPEPTPEAAPESEMEPEPEVQPVGAAPDKAAPPDLKIVAGAKTEKADNVIPQSTADYTFPTLELLQPPSEATAEDIQDHYAIAETLKETLSQFKVEVNLGEIHTGPVITRYEITPAAGVRVEKISNLDKNIALALKAEAVRILAPVPGKGVVGVEVPNPVPQSVCLRDIIETKDWVDSKSEIPIVLGKEVSGRPMIADLTKMPHLLIAGSTGSGKTVCINAIIASLLYRKSPNDLRFIMVDPKIVEMQAFNELPHMLIPVVTEPKKVPAALKWLLAEMERRYQLFATVGVRNIAGFNAKILKNKEEAAKAAEMDAALTPEERAATASVEVPRDPEFDLPKEKIPYIVCIVDELADLMMVAPADIETCIARLAQLARAAGIHLIIATQRPSVNVITGVIKANLPTRISFKVSSKVDSRTILDTGGAEALIGRGDMLFTPPGQAHMTRAQGAFVSDDEITDLVNYIKDRNEPVRYADAVQRHIEQADEEAAGGDGGSGGDGDGDDALIEQAIQVLKSTQRASTSMLQRRLRIGYNRAARVMDELEDRGIVGPENGSSPRDILVDLDSI